MNINKLEAVNFRGQTFTRKLWPVTLITGDNFAGKTTVTDAIKFALSGTLPGVGKTPPLLYGALAGDPEAEGAVIVSAWFDGTRNSTVRLERTKRGAVSQDGVPAADVALDPFLADPARFFSMTAAEQTAAIYRASGAGQLGVEQVAKALWEVEAQPVGFRDEFLRAICDEIKTAPGKYGDQWTTVVADWWKDRMRNAKLTVKQLSGAFAGMKLPMEMPRPADDLVDLRAKRDALVGKRGELRALVGDDARKAQLTERIRAAKSELETKRAELAAVAEQPETAPLEPQTLAQYRNALPVIKQARSAVEGINSDITRRVAELNGLKDVTICPTCGAKANLDAARERMAEGIAQAEVQLADAERKLEALEGQFDLAGVEELTATWECAKQEWGEAHDKRATLTFAITASEQRVRESEAELAKLTGDRDERIAQLQSEVGVLPAVEQQVAEAEARQRAFEDYQRLLAERGKVEGNLVRATCEVEVLAGCIKALTKLVASESEKAFGTVLKLSEAFTDGLLNSPLEFRDGELGRRVAEADRQAGRVAPVGAWIPVQSFSGTENLLAMAGFGIALARLAPFRFVVLDELGRLDQQRREAVANRMVKLVEAGTINQVIMIDASSDGPSFTVPKGVVVIEL